jgi:hypothetical protein
VKLLYVSNYFRAGAVASLSGNSDEVLVLQQYTELC